MRGLETLDGAVHWAAQQMAQAGLPDGRREARLLVAQALKIPQQTILMDGGRALDDAQADAVAAMVLRRCQREPLSRIVGERGFWTLDLGLNADTLDPRPDTETLVEAVIELCPDRQAPLRLVDFGTGTGCILLALLSEYPNARGLGVDLAPGAVDMAQQNAQRNGLAERASFQQGDWAAGLTGPFDVIVSNPPYIATHEMAALEPEVTQYDPQRALVSGDSGYECYETLIPQLPAILAPGGVIALEVGHTQAVKVGELLQNAGFAQITVRPDLAGIARCVIAHAV